MIGLPGSSFTPSTLATVCGTRPGSDERREFHEPGAVRELLECVGGNLQAKARLAAAAGAGEREHAVPCQQRLDLRDLLLPPDEARQLLGQVVRMRRQRLDRWKVARQVGVQKLIHLLRPRQVLELMRAKVAQGNGVGQ